MRPTEIRIAVARTRKAHAIAAVIRRHAIEADADPVASASIISTPEARDIVAQVAGCKLNADTGRYCSDVTWAMAVELLSLQGPSRCRFAGSPGHVCRTNAGQPIHGDQVCFHEARADFLGSIHPADFVSVVVAANDAAPCAYCMAAPNKDCGLCVVPLAAEAAAERRFDEAVSA